MPIPVIPPPHFPASEASQLALQDASQTVRHDCDRIPVVTTKMLYCFCSSSLPNPSDAFSFIG